MSPWMLDNHRLLIPLVSVLTPLASNSEGPKDRSTLLYPLSIYSLYEKGNVEPSIVLSVSDNGQITLQEPIAGLFKIYILSFE